MAQDWWCHVDGHIQGPFDGPALKRMAEQGELQPTDQIRHGANASWEPADSLKGLTFRPPVQKKPPTQHPPLPSLSAQLIEASQSQEPAGGFPFFGFLVLFGGLLTTCLFWAFARTSLKTSEDTVNFELLYNRQSGMLGGLAIILVGIGIIVASRK